MFLYEFLPVKVWFEFFCFCRFPFFVDFFKFVWLEAYYGSFLTIFYWPKAMAFAELLLDLLFIEPKITDQDIFYILRDLILIFFFS